MTSLRRAILVAAAGVGLLSSAAAEGYPTKPVQVLVPYPAGGPFDTIMRALAAGLTEKWKQQVVVDNRGGANETLAAAALARARPDAYTLMIATDATTIHNQFLFKTLPYDTEQAFTPVTRIAVAQLALVVPASSSISSVRELLDRAKESPGKLNYGSASAGNISHIAMAWFAKRNGVVMNHVPYRGAAPMLQDVIGAQIDVGLAALSAVVGPAKAGQLRALAISGERRAAGLPDAPTFKELGLEDPDASFTIGILAPAGAPANIVEKIAGDISTIVSRLEFRTRNIDPFAFDLVAGSPDEFRTFLERERPRQAERIRASGAALD